MKILHFNESYAPIGGTETYLITLMKHLEELSIKNSIIYREKNNNTITVTGRKEYFVPSNINKEAVSLIGKIIDNENPDVINLHDINDYNVIKLVTGKKPTVRYIHGYASFCRGAMKLFRRNDDACNEKFGFLCITNAYLKKCSARNPLKVFKSMFSIHNQIKIDRGLNKLIVASSYMKSTLVNNGFDIGKIEVIPYFIDFSDNFIKEHGDIGNTILFVGRVTEEKGLKYLIHALKYIKNSYKLIIVGDGPLLNEIKRMVYNYNKNDFVQFTGWISDNKLIEYYKKAAFLVMTSIWPEPFGKVGPESMFYNKPVIAFNVGGISDWLKDGENGFLIEPKNTIQMAEKIDLLLQNKELIKKLGDNGLKYVKEQYSYEKHISKLLKVYQDAINNYGKKE